MKAELQLGQFTVVLVAPRNPLNIGAVARAMVNFGFSRLRVVHPYPLAFQQARSAVGATEVLSAAEEFATVEQAVADCHLVVGTASLGRREPSHEAQTLSKAARAIRRRLALRSRIALLFGSEKRGLSNRELSHCHWILSIPTLPSQPSMNLGQAAAVCLYEIARARTREPAAEGPSPAAAATLERLTQLLIETLSASGYLRSPAESGRKRPAAPADEKLRRLVRRLRLSGPDAELLLGMLRQVVWKIHAGRARP